MAADNRTQSAVDRIKADALENAAEFARLNPLAQSMLLRADEIAAGQRVQGDEVVRLGRAWLEMMRAKLPPGRKHIFPRRCYP
jgi:hypothetical protein